jgi:hypothetical protein
MEQQNQGGSLSILWQNTVVDIQPTSRYDKASPDTAVITTTIGYQADGTFTTQTFLNTVPVFTEGDETYTYRFNAPMEHTTLVKGGDISVVVFLPRMAPRDPKLKGHVRLKDYLRDGDPVTLRGEHGPHGLAGREGVAWHWTQDPASVVQYVYEMIVDDNT